MSRLNSVWNQMKQRTGNPNCERYPRYGGRGISIEFESWKHFKEWALSNGYEQGLTIERIDNDGNYSPANCKWIPPYEQNFNKTNTVYLTAWGDTKSLPEWVEDPRCVVTLAALRQRLRKTSLTPEESLTVPLRSGGKGLKYVPGQDTECKNGHDAKTYRRWNARGDYYCRECARLAYHSKKGLSE